MMGLFYCFCSFTYPLCILLGTWHLIEHMDYTVVGHLPPPITGENLCRARLVEVLRECGCHIEDQSRKNLSHVFFGKPESLIIINGQSLKGSFFDFLATFWNLLRKRHVYWYFHNRSWKRFAALPAWIWLGMAKQIYAVTLRQSHANAFRKSGYTASVLNNRIESSFEKQIRPLPEKPPRRLIWMGRPEAAKGFPLALKFFEQLKQADPDWYFDVYGADTEYARKQHYICEGVRYHGFVSGKDKVHAFCQGGIFLLPSQYEIQPVAILEAMACGIPVLASQAGGIPEMLCHADLAAGFSLKEQTPMAYMDATYNIMKDYDRYSSAAREIYRKYYSIDIFKENVLKIFPH